MNNLDAKIKLDSKKKKILLVEDDPTLGEGVRVSLSKLYEVQWCPTFTTGLKALQDSVFDLLILDLGLPDGFGLDLLKNFPTQKTPPPVLILSAQGDPETRLLGYEMGIQEFVPKPFHLKELLLRIENIFKNFQQTNEVVIGDVKINFDNFEVFHNDGKIEYPPVNDLKILKHLFVKAQTAVSRDELINTVWGHDSETSHRTIDNSVARLRQLIGDKDEQWIRSVRGVGYILAWKEST
jgi:DNA-binding response OmpR family regulator